jgi:hypothetical protein
MIGDFNTILNLVGPLDDSQAEDSPRARFREYLKHSLTELGAVRDAVQTCTTHSGPQYARALQDLVNHIGELLGFEVEHGRYAGVTNQIGHDGLWRSSSQVVVVEVKTTDAYTINSATLLNYINSLKSEGRIKPDDEVIGLYIYAKVDPTVKQLQHAIIAEKRTQELRVGTVDAVLSLAELLKQELIGHEEAIAILWPSGVWIDDTVTLLSRVAANEPSPGVLPAAESVKTAPADESAGITPTVTAGEQPRLHLLTPVGDIPEESAKETIERLVGGSVYAFGEHTPGRKRVKAGDRIAFYQAGVGVVAHAEAAAAPTYKPLPQVKNSAKYPWTLPLKSPKLFLDSPIVVDAELRSQLDAFAERDPQKAWAWFVQATRIITEHDFNLLVGQKTDAATPPSAT